MNGDKESGNQRVSCSSEDYEISLQLPDQPLKTPSEIFENFAEKVSY